MAFSLDQYVNCLVRFCFHQLRNIAKLTLIVPRTQLEMIILYMDLIPLILTTVICFLTAFARPPKNICKWSKMLLLS